MVCYFDSIVGKGFNPRLNFSPVLKYLKLRPVLPLLQSLFFSLGRSPRYRLKKRKIIVEPTILTPYLLTTFTVLKPSRLDFEKNNDLEANSTSDRIELRHWLLLVLLSIIWGTSYILIKKAIAVYTPIQVGSLRLSISALVCSGFVWYQWKQIPWKRLRVLLLVGITGTGIPSFLFPLAQVHMNSSLAGILNSLTPLFTLILGMLVFRSRFDWGKTLGVTIGLLGAASLFLFGEKAGFEGSVAYGLLIVLATICYATSTNLVGSYLRDVNSIIISSISFVMVGIPAIFYLFTTGFTTTLAEHPQAWEALGYVSILAIVSTVLASILFFKLVQITSPVFASMISYLVPIVALLWGALDGEVITVAHFLGMALILTGVYLSRKK